MAEKCNVASEAVQSVEVASSYKLREINELGKHAVQRVTLQVFMHACIHRCGGLPKVPSRFKSCRLTSLTPKC